MKTHRICIIGGGNISNTRHIPAIGKLPNAKILGVITTNEEAKKRTLANTNATNSLLISDNNEIYTQLERCTWLKTDVDAVIIGAPPQKHHALAKACLQLGKHVLVEKPMAMSVEQCDEIIDLAERNRKILNVMHTFQFADNLVKTYKSMLAGKYGYLDSIIEFQLSNRNRRLPLWYNELPLGLFYDEAAHFFYLAALFGGGDISLNNATAYFNRNENTPKFLHANMSAGKIPVQMSFNFDSPICEWLILLLFNKKMVVYDFFKDLAFAVDHDDQHRPKNVLIKALQMTYGYWRGFITSGTKMLCGNLLYGHKLCIQSFLTAIETGETDERISGRSGRNVVREMNNVVNLLSSNRT